MDVSEYRRQVEAEVEAAAQGEPGFKTTLRNAGPTGRASGRALTAAPTEGNDLSIALEVLADSDVTDEAFTAALQAMSLEVDDHPELIDTLLEYLVDAGKTPDRRLAVLNVLQEISFRMVGFPAKRPDYLAALRSIIEDPDSQLRRVAIGILAREKDDYVQRRLVEGLEGTSKALVPAAKAIQFLAYDVHSEYFGIAKRIVEKPPSRGPRLRRSACLPPTLRPRICWYGYSETAAKSPRSRWQVRSPCSRSIPRSSSGKPGGSCSTPTRTTS
jgi:hypothetical protein